MPAWRHEVAKAKVHNKMAAEADAAYFKKLWRITFALVSVFSLLAGFSKDDIGSGFFTAIATAIIFTIPAWVLVFCFVGKPASAPEIIILPDEPKRPSHLP